MVALRGIWKEPSPENATWPTKIPICQSPIQGAWRMSIVTAVFPKISDKSEPCKSALCKARCWEAGAHKEDSIVTLLPRAVGEFNVSTVHSVPEVALGEPLIVAIGVHAQPGEQ